MSNIRNENKLCKIHGVLHTDFAQCEEPVIDADTFCKSCKRSNKVCAGSRSCELKIRLQRQRDRRELERNPRATTPPIERNEPRFVTPPEESPTHDTSGRRLDPRNPGKLAQEHQGARAASFDERRKLNTGLHGPVNPVDGAIADLSPAERLYGEREPLVSSDFDPGFESH